MGHPREINLETDPGWEANVTGPVFFNGIDSETGTTFRDPMPLEAFLESAGPVIWNRTVRGLIPSIDEWDVAGDRPVRDSPRSDCDFYHTEWPWTAEPIRSYNPAPPQTGITNP